MEIRYREVCGSVLDQHFFEFCQQCRKYLCFDASGKENGLCKISSRPYRVLLLSCLSGRSVPLQKLRPVQGKRGSLGPQRSSL